jgi:hypothetical protein
MSRSHFALFAVLPALLCGAAVRADEAKADAQAKAAAPAAAPAEGRPYVDAALAFLKGYTHATRKGDQGDAAWAAIKDNAADKVTLKVGGKDASLDVAGKKADWNLVKFSKIATLREGDKVVGVTVETLQLKNGADEKSGKGKVLMTETAGKWTVTSIEVE